MLLVAGCQTGADKGGGASGKQPSFSASDFFVTKPGFTLAYKVTIEGGKAWYAGEQWVSFQGPMEDAVFTFLLSSDTRITGVGRYFKQQPPFFVQSMRNISGESPRFFDFVTLKERLVDGDTYTGYNNFAYRVKVIDVDRVVIDFDARYSKWDNYRGKGSMTLVRGVGLSELVFTQTAEGEYGPAGATVRYSLLGSHMAGRVRITGRVVTADGAPLAKAALALGTYWLNKDSADKPITRVDAKGLFSFEVYADLETPIMFSYGPDANGDWVYDEKYKTLRTASAKTRTGSLVDMGDIVF
jgi:hypothetical protein